MSKENKKWLLMTIGMVLYSSLIFTAPIIKSWCWKSFNLQEVLRYAFGYFFAVILGHFPINMLQEKMWEPLKETDKKSETPQMYRPHYGRVIGFVERALYLVCFQIGARELIPLWIGAKIAGGWKGWQDKKQGRDIFNVVLLGSVFSLAYAFYGYQMIQWACEDAYKLLAVILAGILVSGCWAIWCYLDKSQQNEMVKHNQESGTQK
jgi:hypothetical protein